MVWLNNDLSGDRALAGHFILLEYRSDIYWAITELYRILRITMSHHWAEWTRPYGKNISWIFFKHNCVLCVHWCDSRCIDGIHKQIKNFFCIVWVLLSFKAHRVIGTRIISSSRRTTSHPHGKQTSSSLNKETSIPFSIPCSGSRRTYFTYSRYGHNKFIKRILYQRLTWSLFPERPSKVSAKENDLDHLPRSWKD